jgi:hypothetical protein
MGALEPNRVTDINYYSTNVHVAKMDFRFTRGPMAPINRPVVVSVEQDVVLLNISKIKKIF